MGNYLFISDAAKEVKVESHVLRYWEEELHLPIKRNELGHRYYTEEDVERFKQIKGMKERGLQLKAIKMILKDGKLDMLVPKEANAEETQQDHEEGSMPIDIVEPKENVVSADNKEEKSRRLQWLLQQLIRETLQENNSALCREIKESVVKELDYQFRMQEERDEARDQLLAQQNEEHYRRMDELLRKKARRKGPREKAAKEKGSKEDVSVKEIEQVTAENTDQADKTKEKKKRHFIF